MLRTSDGGSTWQTLSIPGAEKLDFRDVDAVSEQVAYVLSIGSGDSSRIYKTYRRRQDVDAAVHQYRSEGILRRDGVLGREPRHCLQRFGRRTARDPAHGRRRRDVDARPGRRPAARARERRRVRRQRHERGRARTRSRLDRHVGARGSCDRATADSPGLPQQLRSRRGRRPASSRSPSATPQHGIVVGGDYRKESEAIDNAAITSDGGRTWTLVKGLSGFRSVVSYLPGASTPTLIAVGPQGADQSTDDGRTGRR